ncbi:MAG: hypothetical protein HY794_13130 [Desulfarculus sp.]|nr:hypothetical protein [Desulfarculus sp.]
MGRNDLLFARGNLQSYLSNIADNLNPIIEKVPTNQFIASSDEQLLEHFLAELIVEPITLHEDHATMDKEETTLDMSHRFDYGEGATGVPGTKITVLIPYTGDSKLWEMRPSTWSTVFPRARYIGPRGNEPGSLIVEISMTYDEPMESYKAVLDKKIKSIKEYLNYQRQDIESFNNNLPGQLLQTIRARRERLSKHQGLEAVLGIPLRNRPGAPSIEPIKVNKKITVPLPQPPASGFKPEPGIDSSMYEAILKMIRHVTRTFETTPKTYKGLDEEELRDILLANLNGYFEGQAGGEVFRLEGKTDILIKEGDRAAFVAECKVWYGAKQLTQAVDQLLGYLTWLDCKAALIIFNKSVAGFSDLLDKVPATMQSHPLFLRPGTNSEQGEWRFIFRSKEDEGRCVTVHVFLVNVFCS